MYLTYYLRHFWELGRPVCERQCRLRDARCVIDVTSATRVAQVARDSANFVTAEVLFTSLLGGGSSSSRDTRPTSRRPTYYLRHFREAGRLVRERRHPFRDARPIIYVTSRRRVTQFARDSANFVTPDPFFPSLLRGRRAMSRKKMPPWRLPTD